MRAAAAEQQDGDLLHAFAARLSERPVTDLLPPVASRLLSAHGQRAPAIYFPFFFFSSLSHLLLEVADVTRYAAASPLARAPVSGADSIQPPLMFSNQFICGSSRGVADQLQCVGVP